MPRRSQSSANSGRSATKPHPTQAASALRRDAVPRSSAARSRYGVLGPSAATGVEADGLVGLADEHRRSLGGGVQGDRAQVDAGGEPQLAHGVDQPHRRLAAVDDGDAAQTPQVADVHRRESRQPEEASR